MPKTKIYSKITDRDKPYFFLSIRRHFTRLFIHHHFPLVNINPQQSDPHTTADNEEAYHKIYLASEGRLVLTETGYRGDSVRHLLLCHDCQNHIMASFNEVKEGSVCPHCLDDQFLDRFSSIEQLQDYCLDVSLQGAFFLGRNRLGGTMEEERNFFCMIHKEPYQASMKQLFSDSRGCPGCSIYFSDRESPP